MVLLGNILYQSDIKKIKPDYWMVSFIDIEKAKEIQTVVFAKNENKLKILTTNNFPNELKDFVRWIQSKWMQLDISYTTTDGFKEALKWYEQLNQQQQEIKSEQTKVHQAEWEWAISIMKQLYTKRETIEPNVFIMELIRLSFQAWASDVHFQSEEKNIVLRLRIDGILQEVIKFKIQDFMKYMSKIKFISWVKMNINYIPQDGRFSFLANDKGWWNKRIDARVNFIPWIHSESIVIRFLDPMSALKKFDEIGILDYTFDVLKKALSKKSWIIILTWPTWSGKTTTLYSILNYINDWKEKILTLEDPIEYIVDWIQQSQINESKWYTFEQWLKAALRHDPDTILVWEVRTKDTAEISINAAMTGHRVLTTLHVNTVIESINRLSNMWVKPYMIWSSLNIVIWQRLVRKVCPHCSNKKEFDYWEQAFISKSLNSIKNINPSLYMKLKSEIWEKPKQTIWLWCEKCNGTWYIWRIALIEILDINDNIRKQVIENSNTIDLLTTARNSWFITIQEDGIIKVLKWLTTIDELRRVI